MKRKGNFNLKLCQKALRNQREGRTLLHFSKSGKKRNTDYSIQCWKLKAKEVHKFQAPAIQGEMLNLKLFSKLYFVRVRECLETLNKKLCMNVSGSFYSGLTWRFVMNFVAERWKLFWKLLDMLLIVQAECMRRVIRVISEAEVLPSFEVLKASFAQLWSSESKLSFVPTRTLFKVSHNLNSFFLHLALASKMALKLLFLLQLQAGKKVLSNGKCFVRGIHI